MERSCSVTVETLKLNHLSSDMFQPNERGSNQRIQMRMFTIRATWTEQKGKEHEYDYYKTVVSTGGITVRP